jgi:membrane protein implicated in regulation of membrane protease activity
LSTSRSGRAVFARYMVLQIPGAVVAAFVLHQLVRWEQMEPRFAWVLLGLWVLKDLLMFPVTRIAYESGGSKQGAAGMVGALGVTQDRLEPGVPGYVRVGPELWRAELQGDAPVPKGDTVRVSEVRDLTLHVLRADP